MRLFVCLFLFDYDDDDDDDDDDCVCACYSCVRSNERKQTNEGNEYTKLNRI